MYMCSKIQWEQCHQIVNMNESYNVKEGRVKEKNYKTKWNETRRKPNKAAKDNRNKRALEWNAQRQCSASHLDASSHKQSNDDNDENNFDCFLSPSKVMSAVAHELQLHSHWRETERAWPTPCTLYSYSYRAAELLLKHTI